MERESGEPFLDYFERWKDSMNILCEFYNCKSMKKRRFDLQRALTRFDFFSAY